jgi:hypothetical protein
VPAGGEKGRVELVLTASPVEVVSAEGRRRAGVRTGALDHLADQYVVALVPEQLIVAGAAVESVIAVVATQDVVAAQAAQLVVLDRPGEVVGAFGAVDLRGEGQACRGEDRDCG